ncbi:MAG: hypothetical protein ABSH32_25495 [Bryobacteraceae bacterium]
MFLKHLVAIAGVAVAAVALAAGEQRDTKAWTGILRDGHREAIAGATVRVQTLGRNTFRGPDLRNFDLALIKDTPLRERAGAELASLQFRAEFFNVFNIVNFGLPSNILLGPGFGEISRTAGTSRQIQFSLKVIY